MLKCRYLGAAIALAAVAAYPLFAAPAFAAPLPEPAAQSEALPPAALAIAPADEAAGPVDPDEPAPLADAHAAVQSLSSTLPFSAFSLDTSDPLAELRQAYEQEQEKLAREARDERLAYDPALIAAIGNQAESGHTICCPGFACAYGDAIVQGVANDHAVYGCGMCTWPRWGGGNSSFRSLGSNDALLREAYDQIASGKPTVIHVMGAYNEHWITLIGYRDVEDPDALDLANFIALDPYDGAEIVAGEKYSLYGDFCEHVSDR
ncbi:hypothetical protein [Raoultibacter phocaeensis]|uniref:hypothetical protein n=1 Tax=Raoultibacter phocaeensis TaxID=2479841 RepID=UPI002107045B|nr:hypothetical protein [Raoultibacter phocaeensis]